MKQQKRLIIDINVCKTKELFCTFLCLFCTFFALCLVTFFNLFSVSLVSKKQSRELFCIKRVLKKIAKLTGNVGVVFQ